MSAVSSCFLWFRRSAEAPEDRWMSGTLRFIPTTRREASAKMAKVIW